MIDVKSTLTIPTIQQKLLKNIRISKPIPKPQPQLQ